MATEDEIRKGLQEIAGAFAPAVSNIAQVKSVNGQECTCTLVDDDGQEFFEVRLHPVTGKNNGFLQIPEVGTFVLAVRMEDSEDWMVVACDKIARIQVLIGQESLSGIISDLFAAILKMTFTNTAGTTGTTLNAAEFQALKRRIDKIIF
jgi:hypothetical protein